MHKFKWNTAFKWNITVDTKSQSTGGVYRGGAPAPLILDQTEGRRAEKKFFETGPLHYLRVWMTAPTPNLQVWTRHWSIRKLRFTYGVWNNCNNGICSKGIIVDSKLVMSGRSNQRRLRSLKRNRTGVTRVVALHMKRTVNSLRLRGIRRVLISVRYYFSCWLDVRPFEWLWHQGFLKAIVCLIRAEWN